jgi:hypothetical protein
MIGENMQKLLFNILLGGTLVFASLTQNVLANSTESDWRLIAQSHVIVVATLNVPIDEISAQLKSDRPEYIELALTNINPIKGEVEGDLKVRYFPDPLKRFGVPTSAIQQANQLRVLCFLVESGSDLYFAGNTPYSLLVFDSPTQPDSIASEVSRQDQVLQNWTPNPDLPYYSKVKRQIELIAKGRKQKHAFRKLEALGDKAVLAIIDLMDDRRQLKDKGLSQKIYFLEYGLSQFRSVFKSWSAAP